jgi:hypothetical protein
VSALCLRALEIAKRELGKGELPGRNNRSEDVDRFRRLGRAGRVGSAQSWCASFVSYCYRLAAAELQISLPFETSAGAKKLTRLAGKAKSLLTPNRCSPFLMAASAGGIICWHRGLAIDWRGHVGIIERYDCHTDSLWTVEGNKGPLVTHYHYPEGTWRRRLYRLALV